MWYILDFREECEHHAVLFGGFVGNRSWTSIDCDRLIIHVWPATSCGFLDFVWFFLQIGILLIDIFNITFIYHQWSIFPDNSVVIFIFDINFYFVEESRRYPKASCFCFLCYFFFLNNEKRLPKGGFTSPTEEVRKETSELMSIFSAVEF